MWNFETLETVALVGLDYFEAGISCIAFSHDPRSQQSYMIVSDNNEKPKLSLWTDVEAGEPRNIASMTGKELPCFPFILSEGNNDVFFTQVLQSLSKP